MYQPLFDVIFTGQLVDDCNPELAQNNLAQLFKTTPDKVAKVFSGKPQAIKRGLDKAAAMKYKAALHQAGLLVVIKAQQTAATDNINRLVSSPAAPSDSTLHSTSYSRPNADLNNSINTRSDSDWSLASAGSNLLKANEMETQPQVDIDTSNIKMVSAFMDPVNEQTTAPPAPDTSHLTVAASGEDLLVDKPAAAVAPAMDLNAISIAPLGSDLEQLKHEATPLNPDISGISIAEAGADLLEGQNKATLPPAPNTDHISFADD